MSVEFLDTNILIYAHDGGAGEKHRKSVELITRLVEQGTAGVSIQVLSEFYAVSTRKLGMTSREAHDVLADVSGWFIHQPTHRDLLAAARLHRRYEISWWDALIIQSAIGLGCRVLWTEDLSNGQRYGAVTAANPFA
jgi:predicted nucleic acid-binding protein